jgi:WS/DGAT/MGAT family acyltransferase
MVLFELEREAAPAELPDAPDAVVMGQIERFVDAFNHERRRGLGIAKRLPSVAVQAAGAAVSDPVSAARRLAETAASVARLGAPANVPLSPAMTRRSLSVHFDTVTLPLAEAKAAAKAAGGRLNDAFLAATAAGLRRYHEEVGSPAEHVRLSMPINIRDADDPEATGNHFAPARFPLPLSIADPREAMAAMRELVARQRAEPALALVDPLSTVLNRLPTSMTTSIFGAALRGVDVVASNVPGAPIELFTAGSRITSMFALGPMAGSAVNLTLLSYRDQIHIGVNLDPAAVPEPERFLACYRAGWDEVLAVAR